MKTLLKGISIFVFFAVLLNTNFAHSQSENSKISNIIEQKRSFNKNNKSTKVYKIQLFNGSESQAYRIKSNFEASFPQYYTTVVYKTPEWKTQVGNFKTRLEADKALLNIKEKYASAIVLEDKM